MPSKNRDPKSIPTTGSAADWSAMADEALEDARQLPAGPARSEALKLAGELRNTADLYGIVFAPKGRPKK